MSFLSVFSVVLPSVGGSGSMKEPFSVIENMSVELKNSSEMNDLLIQNKTLLGWEREYGP